MGNFGTASFDPLCTLDFMASLLTYFRCWNECHVIPITQDARYYHTEAQWEVDSLTK